jgi:hypothetical protein
MQTIEPGALDAVSGGLSYATRLRAFSQANERLTNLINTGGPGAQAMRYERIMRSIDAYPWRADGSPTALTPRPALLP